MIRIYRYLLAICFFANCVVPNWGIQPALAQTDRAAAVAGHTYRGQVKFAASNISLETGRDPIFLTAYTLTPKNQLYLTAFMGSTLVEQLHRLSPNRSAEELATVGSYQFSFYVDSHLIYTCNLPPDNITSETKRTETILKNSLIAYPRQRTWGESIWSLFLRNGGQQALTDGQHMLKLEIRPFTNAPDLNVGSIVAEGQLALTVQLDPKIDPATVQLQIPQPYQDIAVSTEKFDADKIKELKGKTDAFVFKDISSIVVLKNGKLLIEEYFNGANRNTLHDVRSVGKSFASTAAGIALGEGYLKSENQSLQEFYNLKDFAHYSPIKGKITLKDLLTMSAAFEGNDDQRESAGNEEKMYPTSNWVKFALDLPVDSVRKAGEWHYFTAGVVLLGDIIDKRVPGGLEKYTDEKLFRPLGITQYKWQYTPQKVANTAGGIRMNALDFAKYGQLYKNGGQWKGQQLVPKDWVEKTFTRHKVIPGRENEHYGYLFWNRTYKVNGHPYETYYCAGNGGNKIYVFKDQPLVIVVTATAFGAPYAHPQVDKMMSEYILPALKISN
ncbi:serine hydrolase [Spirosoma sp. BT702]|uniref:Serine hydrolase n=1 Tax=Spirosoma profusum TaxID=2771354 RepID=A0A927AWH6_9BACT|nr:serine hydrolase [Spirosoma profusum]MBD2705661.1 serine hydrolase [Spirosoma profusum]